MKKSKESGQGLLFLVLIMGSIMAFIIIFGAKRQADVSTLVERLETSQAASEALSAAAKRIQHIYANESGCDPDLLEKRLNRMESLPDSPTALGLGTGYTYAIAQPNVSDSKEREGRCNLGSGCRELAIPIDGRIYVVRAGYIATPNYAGAANDCPRDATVRLSVAVKGSLYKMRATLINICTLQSCTGSDSFNAPTITASSAQGWTATMACTGAFAGTGARYRGSMVSATNTVINVDDLRLARRYLETGGGEDGETTYMYVGAVNGNNACTPATSNNQCVDRPCIPALDLNRDKRNTDVDLAILEYTLRGYMTSLPVTRLL